VPAYIKKAVQILKLGTNLDLQEDGNKCHRGEGRTLSNDWRRPKEFEAAKNCRGTDWNCAMKAAGWMKRGPFLRRAGQVRRVVMLVRQTRTYRDYDICGRQ